jgi:outer membrane receptor protein involved in Fe transport
VRLLDQKLTIGARGYITSKSFLGLPNATPGASPFLDGYTTVDIFSSYKVTEDVNVALTVTNVGDVAFTPALSSGGITNTERTLFLLRRDVVARSCSRPGRNSDPALGPYYRRETAGPPPA